MTVTSDAAPLSEGFIFGVLDAMDDQLDGAEPIECEVRDEDSNDTARVRFDDGRTLMLKRARVYPEDAADRFDTARLASRLLRERTDVVAPVHLDVPDTTGELPLMAYWRIARPTLKSLWRDLSDRQKPRVLRGWGRLMRRIHSVRTAGFGPLLGAYEEPVTIGAALSRDLEQRLMPALPNAWPDGVALVERLIDAIPEVAERLADAPTVLCHNDMHMANVLCETERDRVRCVGVLDLEYACAAVAGSDLAKAEIFHGPLFGQPLQGAWSRHLWEGLATALDPLALAFFRAYHLANSGFHSALIGQNTHANEIGRAAGVAIGALE